MAKIKTKRRTKGPRGVALKTKRELPPKKSEPDESAKLEETEREKKPSKPRPHLSIFWPILLVTAILSCIAIPFVPFAEKILIAVLVFCSVLISTYLIIKHEKELMLWYEENPDKVPGSKKRRKKLSRRRKQKKIVLKK